MVAIEVWTNGPRYERKQTGGADLSAFKDYVNDVIKKTSEFKNIRIDMDWFYMITASVMKELKPP